MKKPLFAEYRQKLLFAHRGCSAEKPENTLASFRKAAELEIPGIELDVHRCGSGELVVIHDANTLRTTGTDMDIASSPYSAIRDLDAGKGEYIPLLRDVFRLCGSSMYYDIEVKHDTRGPAGFEEQLLGMIYENNLQTRTIVSSFNPFVLRRMKELDSRIPAALIYSSDREVPPLLRRGGGRLLSNPDILKPYCKQVSRITPLFTGPSGRFPVLPWTVDTKEEAHRLLQLGVRGLISNVPELLLPVIREFSGKFGG